MIIKRIIYTIIFSICITISWIVWSQNPTKNDLEKRRNTLLKEIQQTQKLLEETKQNKSATLSELKALQAKLHTRQQLINGINSEISSLENNIKSTSSDVNFLSNKLKSQQAAYAASVRHAYKNKESENFVAFLFAASDFNDAIRRLNYLRRYNDFRKAEGEKIVKTQASLNNKISALSQQKTEKSELLNVEKTQTDQLLAEKRETDKLMQELKGKEKELASRIAKDRATSAKLESSIKEMIRKEILIAQKKAEQEALAKKKAEEAALAKKKAEEELARKKLESDRAVANNSGKITEGLRTGSSMRGETATTTTTTNNNNATGTQQSATQVASKPAAPNNKVNLGNGAGTPTPTKPKATTESYKMNLTPDVQTISNNFGANQGRLPWPLEKGYISGHYGKHPHPLYPSITVENLGIDISTNAGASVRSVFEGTVTKINNIDGYIIMISHGEYFTIYSGLASVNVKQGDKVNSKQNIGVVGKNEDGVPVLNFQVWKVTGNNFSTLNPASWIAR